jgi:hypothetical protein
MSKNEFLSPFAMVIILVSFMMFGGIAMFLIQVSPMVAAAASGIFGVFIFGFIWHVRNALKGSVQELRILVDLPAGVDVKAAPLILNSVDASLLAYLLKRCTVKDERGKTMLHYRRRGAIYDPKHCTFEVNGATYRPAKLKVLYCR